jgi:filamentous hemagglutinin family protein
MNMIKQILAFLAIFTMVCPAQIMWAAPRDGQVVRGQAEISQSGPDTSIEQSSRRAVINWNSFDIEANENVRHNMPDSGSAGLHRVIGGHGASQIAGRLESNGNIFLVNPDGAVIHNGAKIDTGGFVATTNDISDDNFMGGNLDFDKPGNPGASIVNKGDISVRDRGLAALVAPTVRNEGLIAARLGTVALASGEAYKLDVYGDNLINFNVKDEEVESLHSPDGVPLGVENTGKIKAEGGVVLLSASQLDSIVGSVVNNGGMASVASAEIKGGKIVLRGEGDNVDVVNTGILDASSEKANGGSVLLVADAQTSVSGILDASSDNSDGGFIETSGADVKIAEDAIITTNAPNGQTGTWLIDPNDYTVASSGGNITGATLGSNLSSNNVEIATNTMGSPGGKGDIFINDEVSWDADTTLTLTAGRNVNINNEINATGANAGLSLNYNGSSGNFTVNAPVNLTGINASLNINGADYTFINNLESLRNVNYGKYALRHDIDLNNADLLPIGESDNHFEGVLEGLGHIIKNINIKHAASFVGLFDVIQNGEVRNLILNGSVTGGQSVGMLAGVVSSSYIYNVHSSGAVGVVSETGAGLYVGGLVGFSSSTVTNSYATGNVTGYARVGGLVGGIESSADVTNSYATGKVTGITGVTGGPGYYVGGLVGILNQGTVKNSYATGTVTGPNNIIFGGLIGYRNAGTVENSYWDTESTNQIDGCGNIKNCSGVIPLTKTQSLSQDSYEGWDFTDIWYMPANGTPMLLLRVLGGEIDDDIFQYIPTNITVSSAPTNGITSFNFDNTGQIIYLGTGIDIININIDQLINTITNTSFDYFYINSAGYFNLANNLYLSNLSGIEFIANNDIVIEGSINLMKGNLSIISKYGDLSINNSIILNEGVANIQAINGLVSIYGNNFDNGKIIITKDSLLAEAKNITISGIPTPANILNSGTVRFIADKVDINAPFKSNSLVLLDIISDKININDVINFSKCDLSIKSNDIDIEATINLNKGNLSMASSTGNIAINGEIVMNEGVADLQALKGTLSIYENIFDNAKITVTDDTFIAEAKNINIIKRPTDNLLNSKIVKFIADKVTINSSIRSELIDLLEIISDKTVINDVISLLYGIISIKGKDTEINAAYLQTTTKYILMEGTGTLNVNDNVNIISNDGQDQYIKFNKINFGNNILFDTGYNSVWFSAKIFDIGINSVIRTVSGLFDVENLTINRNVTISGLETLRFGYIMPYSQYKMQNLTIDRGSLITAHRLDIESSKIDLEGGRRSGYLPETIGARLKADYVSLNAGDFPWWGYNGTIGMGAGFEYPTIQAKYLDFISGSFELGNYSVYADIVHISKDTMLEGNNSTDWNTKGMYHIYDLVELQRDSGDNRKMKNLNIGYRGEIINTIYNVTNIQEVLDKYNFEYFDNGRDYIRLRNEIDSELYIIEDMLANILVTDPNGLVNKISAEMADAMKTALDTTRNMVSWFSYASNMINIVDTMINLNEWTVNDMADFIKDLAVKEAKGLLDDAEKQLLSDLLSGAPISFVAYLKDGLSKKEQKIIEALSPKPVSFGQAADYMLDVGDFYKDNGFSSLSNFMAKIQKEGFDLEQMIINTVASGIASMAITIASSSSMTPAFLTVELPQYGWYSNINAIYGNNESLTSDFSLKGKPISDIVANAEKLKSDMDAIAMYVLLGEGTPNEGLMRSLGINNSLTSHQKDYLIAEMYSIYGLVTQRLIETWVWDNQDVLNNPAVTQEQLDAVRHLTSGI